MVIQGCYGDFATLFNIAPMTVFPSWILFLTFLLVHINPNHKRFIEEWTTDNKIQVAILSYQMRALEDFTLANLSRRFYSSMRKLSVGNGLSDCRIQPTLTKSPPSVIGSLSKHDVDESENVIWTCDFAFLQPFFNYSNSLCLKNVF